MFFNQEQRPTSLLPFPLLFGAGAGAQLTASDTAGGTDAATRATQAFTRTASDTAGGTDSGTRQLSLARTASDTAGGTDAATRQLSLPRTSADTAGGTDTATR